MFPLVAALPMYDWPEVRAETDRTWAALRDRLRTENIPAPKHLARRNADLPPVPGGIRDASGRIIAPDPAMLPPDEFHLPTLWRHPSLLLSQTCWGPMEQGLAADVTVVGQGDYSEFEGGDGPLYSSAVLMRPPSPSPLGGVRSGAPEPVKGPAKSHSMALGASNAWSHAEGQGSALSDGMGALGTSVGENPSHPAGDPPHRGDGERALPPLDILQGKRLAYNGTDSMSGLIALQRDLEAAGESLALFSAHLETGSHRASIVAVAEGTADVCAVDCRTWDLARRFEPNAAALSVIGWTAERLGLPFITARGTDAKVQGILRAALGAIG